MESGPKLTDKQRVFIEEYLTCWNATEAARRAGYSERSIRVIAAENLTKPNISAEIKRRIEEKAMGADELLTRVAEHARGDLAEYIDITGQIDIQRLRDDGLGHLLKKYKKVVKRTISKDGREFETEYYEAELYPADAALDKLMRYHGLYRDKVEHTWRDKLPPEKASTADEFFRKVAEGLAAQLNENGNRHT